MKSLRSLSLCAFALSLASLPALADDSSAQVQRRVEDGLVKPLAASEGRRSAFSRVPPMPRERRVRVTQASPTQDAAGNAFMAFAIDARFRGGEWRENDIIGCAYAKTGELFVKSGDGYRPAAVLLGKTGEPVAGVCEAAPARS